MSSNRHVNWDHQIESAILKFMAQHNGLYPWECRVNSLVFQQLFLDPTSDRWIKIGMDGVEQVYFYRGMRLGVLATEPTFTLIKRQTTGSNV